MKLGFIIWTEDDSIVCNRGEKGEFSDGLLVSLYHTAKDYLKETGKEISQVEFKIQLEQNGQNIAEHTFNMNKMSTFWLIVDPSNSDDNGTFTTVFLNVFVNTPVGTHDYIVKLFTDGELFNEGELSFTSDGTNSAFKNLIPKFDNVAETREQANLQHQQEYAEQLEKEDAEQEAAREFKVYIENTDSGHTKYIVSTNQSSMSETIYEIQPLQTLTLNLFRCSVFEIKYFDQDSSKENAFFIENIDETFHDAKYKIN